MRNEEQKEIQKEILKSLSNEGKFESIKTGEIYNSSMYKVYGLINPETNHLFYIGKTNDRMIRRLFEHYRVFSGSKRKTEELKQLSLKGLVPKVKIYYLIENEKEAEIVEKYLINFLMMHTNMDIYNFQSYNGLDVVTTYMKSMKIKLQNELGLEIKIEEK